MCAGISLDDLLKVVEILFYLAMPFIAGYGLSSWKHELHWRAEYEVATNVLAGAYRVRDAIKQAQAPFMTPGEWAGRQKKESETEQEALVYNSFYAFSNRFRIVRDAVSEWYPHMVRGEALFGAEAKKAIEALGKIANKLWMAIEMWHQNELQNRGSGEGFASLYNIMYGIDPSQHPELPVDKRKDNGFHAEFASAVSGIEQIFRPYVRRGKD